MVLSGFRKLSRASCGVMVSRPARAVARQVVQQRARQADWIDAAVVVKAPVFDRDHLRASGSVTRRERNLEPLLLEDR